MTHRVHADNKKNRKEVTYINTFMHDEIIFYTNICTQLVLKNLIDHVRSSFSGFFTLSVPAH